MPDLEPIEDDDVYKKVTIEEAMRNTKNIVKVKFQTKITSKCYQLLRI